MTKEVFESFITTAREKGITKYAIRCEGGNRIVYHNDETSKLVLKADEVISVALSRNYAVSGQSFVFTVVTYDCIDSVLLNDIPFSDSVEVAKSLGIYNDEMEAFFKQVPNRRDLKPGTAGLAEIKDNEGNILIGTGSLGYVTK